jgi:signal transduction histidine kinase
LSASPRTSVTESSVCFSAERLGKNHDSKLVGGLGEIVSEIAENAGSKPVSPSRELVDAYTEGLLDYLVRPQEPALQRAREIGRDAMTSGLSLSDMSMIHHESVRKLLVQTLGMGQYQATDSDPLQDSYLLLHSLVAAESAYPIAAARFFAASISPFETNQHESQQAIAVLRYRNSKLEEQIRQFSTLVFDEALQLLAAAGLALGDIRRKPVPAGGKLDEVQSLLSRIGDHLTACASELQPRVLEDLGLGAAIQSISRRFSAAAQFDIVADTAVGPLRPAVSAALYRAVEESLTNVMRHAQAHHVRICVCSDADVVKCSIGDDGIGFDASEVLSGRAKRASGLICVRESLRVLGGTLAIHSAPGSGTEVVMTVRTVDQTRSHS